MQPLPADLSLFVAAIAAGSSAWLRTDGLTARTNALIAAGVFIVLVLLAIFMTTGFSSDLRTDLHIIVDGMLVVAGAVNEGSDLLGYLKTAQSPLAPKTPPAPMAVKAAVKDLTARG